MPANFHEPPRQGIIPQRSAWEERSNRERVGDQGIEAARWWLKRYDRLGAGLGRGGGLLLLVDGLLFASLFFVAATQPLPSDFWGFAAVLLLVLAVLLLGLSMLLASGTMLPDWKFKLPSAGAPPDPDPPVLNDPSLPLCSITRVASLEQVQGALKRSRGAYQLQQRFLSVGVLSMMGALALIALLALLLWIVP